MQAGGRVEAATNYFFPLDRVKRALEFIQRGEHVPRGTIQVQWLFKPFDEVRRLGLLADTEAEVRKQDSKQTGMLVAETVVPEGPGFMAGLEEGDVLIRVNGNIVTRFVPVEATLDDSVGRMVKIEIERGGEPMTFEIPVGDLHAITPDRYVEVCGAKFNTLSYQLARAFCVPVKGVYICESTGSFNVDGGDGGWILTSIDGNTIETLETFIDIMKTIPDRARVPVVYYNIADVHMPQLAIITIERHWTPFKLVVRNDATGVWDFTDLGDAIPPKPLEPVTAKFVQLGHDHGPIQKAVRSLVKVSYYMPVRIDGYPKSRKTGAGLVVDHKLGIIIVGKSIVPFALGDISLTFADSVVIPGKVLFIHPTHNFAFLTYDPNLLGQTPIRSAKISDSILKESQRVNLIAFNHNFRVISITTTVTDITSVSIPPNPTPRFRSTNFDAITVDTPLSQQCSSGILADDNGHVQGLWLTYLGEQSPVGDNEYYLGLHIQVALPLIEALRREETPQLRNLNVEFVPAQLVQIRQMGLPQSWVEKVEAEDPERHQLYVVRKVEAGAPSAKALEDLDLVLTVNHKLVTRIYDMDAQYTEKELSMVILHIYVYFLCFIDNSERQKDQTCSHSYDAS